MKNLINTRLHEEPVYSITQKKAPNEFIIERYSLPCLKVLYNAYTKKENYILFFQDQCPMVQEAGDLLRKRMWTLQ